MCAKNCQNRKRFNEATAKEDGAVKKFLPHMVHTQLSAGALREARDLIRRYFL